MGLNLHISRGNSKIGPVPNLSLPPGLTCSPNRPCEADCYAKKFYRMRKNVRDAWDDNLHYWQMAPSAFRWDLMAYLQLSTSRYFRWHVGGDIPDADYWAMMCDMARYFPSILFMAYSRTGVVSPEKNLVVIRSHWLKEEDWDSVTPHAYVRKDEADPVPGQVGLVCPGSCPSCGYYCWYMEPGEVLLFPHRSYGGRHAKISIG